MTFGAQFKLGFELARPSAANAREGRGKRMIICDLCGNRKSCLQKEIEGMEYDICSECWNPLADKLKGKGRPKHLETVFLQPPRQVQDRGEEPKPLPGEPPKIWGEGNRVH